MSGDDLVLVTGATGSIGWPLLESLSGDGVQVVALVRGRPPATLPGVRFQTGDIERPDLGLDRAAVTGLQARVTTIIHAAALTRFDAPLDAARRVNVEGTRHVLSFADDCPHLMRVAALSTIYVAGKRTGVVRERELDHECGFVNAYEESKHEAEQLVREAMGRLPVIVLRMSTVLGAEGSGTVRRPAAIHHAMRFLYLSLLPMMPGSADSPVDLISTDYAVAAVRHFADAGFLPGQTRHICAAEDAPREAELIDLVVGGFMRYRPAWRRRAIEKPAIVALRTFDLFRESVDAVADPALKASVAVLAPFAPQLAFPKCFDDSEAQRSLTAAGLRRSPIRDTIMDVVRYLVENNWGDRSRQVETIIR